eukprot:TRINITY_DN7237_c0_g1_i2.p1 TRINITY_DN7237_c0_g1~~TRINITY_DN7237_c0_g1_i2.p1  ORF type:complete len:803 (+),score=320.43 TRINITY_DN7237_c0_g1_i2:79-2487(+)
MGQDGEGVVYSDAVNGVLRDALPSDTEFDDPGFDPLEYFNRHFSDERSLKGLDAFLTDLDMDIAETTHELRQTFRQQGETTVQAEQNLVEAKSSIKDLFSSVEEIRKMAEESENMVREICTEISSLDNAKKNLTDSITTLKEMRNIARRLEQLEQATDSNPCDLGAASEGLVSINRTFENCFSKYMHVARVKEISEKVQAAKDSCAVYAMEELGKVDLTASDDLYETTVLDACSIIDCCGESMRKAAVKAFVDRHMDHYTRQFPAQAEESRLEKMERRFAYFRRMLKSYDDGVQMYVPDAWNVTQDLAVEFCLKTLNDVQGQLAADAEADAASRINIEIVVRVLQKSMEFEAELTEKMKPVEPKAKHGQAPPAARPAVNFRGFITCCFEDTMARYVEHEDERMKAAIAELWNDPEQTTVNDDGQPVTISAAVGVFVYIKESLKKCSAFCKEDMLVKMFGRWSENLVAFAHDLSKLIPENPKGEKEAEEELRICAVINSADWCYDTCVKLAEEVQRKVGEEFEISEDAVAEQFRAVTHKGLIQLITNCNRKLSVPLNDMLNITWGTMCDVGDQSPYVVNVCSTIASQFTQYANALQPPLFRYLCGKFIDVFVPRYIAQFYRLKRLSPEACQQLLLDFQSFGEDCPKIPNLGKPGRFKDKELRGFLNILKSCVGRGESILKFLTSIMEGIPLGQEVADQYIELVPHPSVADFAKLCELRGIGAKDSKSVCEYLKEKKNVPQTTDKEASQYMPPGESDKGMSLGGINMGNVRERIGDAKEMTEKVKKWKGRVAKIGFGGFGKDAS